MGGDALLEGARIAFTGAAALWVLGVIATLWLRKPADAVPAEPDHRDPATGPLPAAPEPAAARPAEPAARSVPAEPAP